MAQAALVIQAGDIDDSSGEMKYEYKVPWGDMAGEDGINSFLADMSSYENIAGFGGTGSRHFHGTPGSTTASLEFTFDFAPLGLQVESVQLVDRVVIFVGTTGDEDTLITTEYSVDGVNYTPITVANSTGETATVDLTTGFNPPLINFASPVSTVYYRVRFESLVGDGDGAFTAQRNQWNRTDSGKPTFKADFTLVPEPASLVLVALGGLVIAGRRRHA